MSQPDRTLAVEYRPLAALIPYARNARTHTDEQIAQIAASIREFGFTNPLLVDGASGIIAGHGRLLAARKVGMATVPVIELAGMTEAQKRAYVIADNKLALNAGWDRDLLGLELTELDGLGFDMRLTGFTGDELGGLLNIGNAGLTDPDEIPDVPDQPVSRAGDVWLLGRHRLFCGDSTNADDVRVALNGIVPHLMVTDPPYGVNYEPGWRKILAVNPSGLRARSSTTTVLIGGTHGHCSPAMSPMSGTELFTRARSPRVLNCAALRSGARSSGTKAAW